MDHCVQNVIEFFHQVSDAIHNFLPRNSVPRVMMNLQVYPAT